MGITQLTSARVGQLRARELDPLTLGPRELAAWAQLAERARPANAYLTPSFVLPALRHLSPGAAPRLVVIDRDTGGLSDWVGLALLEPGTQHRTMPLPHLQGFASRHSYLDAPLIDGELGVQAAQALILAISQHAGIAAGVLWQAIPSDHPLLRATARHPMEGGMTPRVAAQRQRAVLTAAGIGQHSRSALKDRHRSWRRLQELGDVSWHFHRHDMPAQAVDTFMRLEHSGWKGQAGTSLLSHRSDTAFFREVAASFAQQRALWITELRLDGRVVASTANFAAGREGFAFKIGWDASLRQHGVGVLNELQLMQAYAQVCPQWTQIDSGASSDAFIGDLWPERRTLCRVFLPLNRAGQAAWWLRERLKSADTDPAEAA
jgi:hypothetical protein